MHHSYTIQYSSINTGIQKHKNYSSFLDCCGCSFATAISESFGESIDFNRDLQEKVKIKLLTATNVKSMRNPRNQAGYDSVTASWHPTPVNPNMTISCETGSGHRTAEKATREGTILMTMLFMLSHSAGDVFPSQTPNPHLTPPKKDRMQAPYTIWAFAKNATEDWPNIIIRPGAPIKGSSPDVPKTRAGYGQCLSPIMPSITKPVFPVRKVLVTLVNLFDKLLTTDRKPLLLSSAQSDVLC